MSGKSKEASERRTQLWKYHLKKWSESGQSQNAYCRDNNLRPNRFTYWKNKRQNLPVEFIQVATTQITEAVNELLSNVIGYTP